MTKRWIFKIDTPWGKKGSVFDVGRSRSTWVDKDGNTRFCLENPQNYPDLFELVEEKSDEERFIDWLTNEVDASNMGPSELLAFISKKIISAGVDVKKLGVK